jgi:chemotaxis protein methyltransferase CheR
MIRISEAEFALMARYIEQVCGIHLRGDKAYLIESRLSDLVEASGCRSFQAFLHMARDDGSGALRDRIVDAITTNETSWFRDASAWTYLAEAGIPEVLTRALAGKPARVWSAAVSTGQEVYSLLMLMDEILQERGLPSFLGRVEIMATDISSSALAAAQAARYDSLSIARGLSPERKYRYFTPTPQGWVFEPRLRDRVRFRRYNLQDNFTFFGHFDLVLCRYVSIYFSDDFKRELFRRMARVVRPGGVLLLGATESLREFSDDFEIRYFKNAVINVRKRDGT